MASITRLFPPLNFATVEENLYRSSMPSEINFDFLANLKLKLVIVLSAETVDEAFKQFLDNNFIQISILAPVSSALQDSDGFVEETILSCLKLLTDKSNLPALVICRTGRSATSVAIACLRKAQKWSLYSIFEEYRRFSGGNLRLQHLNEQYIELFDPDSLELSEESSEFFTKYK